MFSHGENQEMFYWIIIAGLRLITRSAGKSFIKG